MNPSFKLYAGRFVLLRHAYAAVDPNLPHRPPLTPNVGANASDSSSFADHWDLMLQTAGGRLLTWQLPQWPDPEAGPNAHPLTAKRIPDHRAHYLDYEGPISGDRGHVRQVAAGRYTAILHPLGKSACMAIDPSQVPLWQTLNRELEQTASSEDDGSATVPLDAELPSSFGEPVTSHQTGESAMQTALAIRLHSCSWVANLLVPYGAVDQPVDLVWQYVGSDHR